MGQPSPFQSPILRDDLPRYPPLVQLIRITSTTVAGPSGVQGFSSSILGPILYVAFVQQLKSDSLLPRDREPCLADDVNGRGLPPGYYLGRLANSWTSLPVYEIVGAPVGVTPIRWVEITGHQGYTYSGIEVEPAPPTSGVFATVTGTVFRRKSGGQVFTNELTERNRYANVRIGSIVQIYPGTSGVWIFEYEYDHFRGHVTGGTGPTYTVEEDSAGSNKRVVTATEFNSVLNIPSGTVVKVWVYGSPGNLVYMFSHPVGQSQGCNNCTTTCIDCDIFNTTIINNISSGTSYCIFEASTGEVQCYLWMCVDGYWCGWWDPCACTWVGWWCCASGCTQGFTNPGGCTGPYATKALCGNYGSCIPAYKWWCVGCNCVQSILTPSGNTGGPYDTQAACLAACSIPYWCTRNPTTGVFSCVQSCTRPATAVGGSYSSLGLCQAQCTTPSCDEDTCDCDVCPTGAPMCWYIPLNLTSQFPEDSDFAVLNGFWVLSYGGDCIWNGALNGCTAVLSFQSGLPDLIFTVPGVGQVHYFANLLTCCAQFQMAWDEKGPATYAPSPIPVTPPISSCGPCEEVLVWYCTTDVGCVSQPIDDPPPANWDGVGPYFTESDCMINCLQWYCVDDDSCESVPFGDPPPSGATDGPFATESLCQASCGSISVGCCPGVMFPSTLVVRVTSATGDMASIPSTFTITWDGSLWSASNVWVCDGAFKGFTVQCAGADAEDFLATALDNTAVDPGATCSPLFLRWTAATVTPDCTGSATFTVTES